jgi:GDP-L-fucose synthase
MIRGDLSDSNLAPFLEVLNRARYPLGLGRERAILESHSMESSAFYKGRKVLVTGSTGLLGANLIAPLLRLGASVRATFRKKPPVVVDPRVEYIPAELTLKDSCASAVKGVDGVFHCAANTSGAQVIQENPTAHITENILINSHLLEAAATGGVEHFLFVSSSCVYPPSPLPVREEEAFAGDPHEAYFGVGWMKRFTEKLAEFYHRRFGLRVTIVRCTNVYGPYDKFDPVRSHVFPSLIRRALEREDPYVVWGDGTAERDFIYVEDCARAMLDAAALEEGYGVLNLGSGEVITIRDAVDLVLKLTGHSPARVIYDSSKPSTIPLRKVDLTKIRSLLGFRPTVSLEEGLRRTIRWYEETSGPIGSHGTP